MIDFREIKRLSAFTQHKTSSLLFAERRSAYMLPANAREFVCLCCYMPRSDGD